MYPEAKSITQTTRSRIESLGPKVAGLGSEYANLLYGPDSELANQLRLRSINPLDLQQYTSTQVAQRLQFFPTLIEELERAETYGVEESPFVTALTNVDQDQNNETPFYLDDSTLPISITLERILSDPKLYPRLLRDIDTLVKSSSLENKDRAKKPEGLDAELVIVGGGLATSIVAPILSKFYKVTVITEEDSIGAPFRDTPLHINSSTGINELGSPNLPLLGGTSTPIAPTSMPNTTVQPNNLFPVAGLVASCPLDSDNPRRNYIPAPELGRHAATNIALHTQEFMTNTRIDPSKSRTTRVPGQDPITTLHAIDAKTGDEMKIKAKKVLFLTGIGSETNIVDPITRTALQNSIRSTITRIEYAIKYGEGDFVNLPPILDLKSLRLLYKFWSATEKTPDFFPLRTMFDSQKDVLVAGGRDTSNCLIELLTGYGPRESYPPYIERQLPNGEKERITTFLPDGTIDPRLVPSITLAISEEVGNYVENKRPRYRRALEEAISTGKLAIVNSRLLQATSAGEVVGSVLENGTGIQTDFLFLATGLKKSTPEQILPRGNTPLLRSTDFGVLGYTTLEKTGAEIGGAACGFTRNQLPETINLILGILGVPENTVALWVWANLLERHVIDFLKEYGASETLLEEILLSIADLQPDQPIPF